MKKRKLVKVFKMVFGSLFLACTPLICTSLYVTKKLDITSNINNYDAKPAWGGGWDDSHGSEGVEWVEVKNINSI